MLYNSDVVITLKDDDSSSIKNAKLYLEKELNEGDCAWLKRILVTIQENKNEWPMEIYVTNILEDKLTREKKLKTLGFMSWQILITKLQKQNYLMMLIY